MMSTVIIGSGLAGYTAAREIRKHHKTDDITLVTQDDGHFYSKPILSEALRSGLNASDLVVRTSEKMAQQIRGQVLTHQRVMAIDKVAQIVSLQGRTLAYDNLVLATGAEPVPLPLDSDSLSNVLAVNSLSDYQRFRSALEGKKTIAIIGAGLVGCEFANDLADAGYQVTLIDIAAQPLARLLPAHNATFTVSALQNIGVNCRLNTGVNRIERKASSYVLSLSDQSVLEVDVVLAATGLRPNIALAQQAGLEVAHGIVVNAQLRTSASNIYAIGDCAEVEGLWLPYIAPIAPAARILAKALGGAGDDLQYAAMPVTIKTPACPTVVCLPPAQSDGRWESECAEAGVKSSFFDPQGQLLGFALSGSFVGEARELATSLPALLETRAAMDS